MGEGGRKGKNFIVVCSSPDVCFTPLGPIMVPVPYQVVAHPDQATMPSHNVFFGGEAALLADQSMVMKVEGNEAGMGGGIKSGHNQWILEFDEGSSKVHVNGKKVVRHGDTCWMNGRNTRGKVICTDGMEPACSIENGRPTDFVQPTSSKEPNDRGNKGGRGEVTVRGRIKTLRRPQPYSLCWQTLSAVDGAPGLGVDVIAINPEDKSIKRSFSTGEDGCTERLKNETSAEDYETLVGSGEWTMVITSDEDPDMLESTDWFDWEAEE